MTKALHLMMNSKGGVGKSFCSLMLAQYLKEHQEITVLDTDPSNQTLKQFESLNAIYVDVRSQDAKTVDIGLFDALFGYIDNGENIILVDSGASSFIQFFTYLTSEGAQQVFAEQNWELYVHIPIVGGGSYNDCLENIRVLSAELQNAKIIVWINNFPSFVFDASKKQLELEKIQNLAAGKLLTMVELPRFEPSTTGRVLKAVVAEHHTFTDFEDSKDLTLEGKALNVMDRFRIKKIKQDIFNAISVLDAYIS